MPAGHPATAGVRAGATFGASEAAHVATMMGGSFALEIAEVGGADDAARTGRRFAAAGMTVVGGVDALCCRALAAALPDTFLEVRARRELRRELEGGTGLAVTPGWETHADALVRGLRGHGITRAAFAPDAHGLREKARRAGMSEVAASQAEVLFIGAAHSAARVALCAGVELSPGPGVAAPVGWHATLRRYGAGELNERYRATVGRGMDEDAWYGWVAVKLVVEAGLRGRRPAAMRIDGHKGRALGFAGGWLEQPLYVVLDRGEGVEVVDA